MSFLSKVADYIRGVYEIFCDTEPDLERKAHKATKRGISVVRSHGQEDSKDVGMKDDHTESNIYSEKPPRRNKIIQYVTGEMDVLCFAPSPEDFSSASIRTSVCGLLPDDEDDDLIYVDIGNKYHSKISGGTSMNITNRANTTTTSKDSLSDGHHSSTIIASSEKYSTMDHHDLLNSRNPTNMMNYNPSTDSHHAGSINMPPQTYSLTNHPNLMSSSDTYFPNINHVNSENIKKDNPSDSETTLIGRPNLMSSSNTHVTPHKFFNSESIQKKLYFEKNRPSPTSVITGVASSSNTDTHVNNPNSFVNIDRADSCFLKGFNKRDNKNFIDNLLDLDDTEPDVADIQVPRERAFDFESAGFSPETALMIKRRIKLQKLIRRSSSEEAAMIQRRNKVRNLVRSLNSNLSD